MLMRRRRPLARAAMIGGTAYVAGKAGQKSAMNQQEAQMQEQDQQERIAQLEAQQAQAQSAPPAAAGGDDLVEKLNQLTQLRDSGALTPEQFEEAKQKLLGA